MNKKKTIQIIIVLIIFTVIGGLALFKLKEREDTTKYVKSPNGHFAFEEEGPIDYPKLFEKGLPVIVNYGSEGCGPCRAFKPTMVAINSEMEGKAFIKYVDIWKYEGAQGNVPISVIPTQVFFNGDGTNYQPTEDEKQLGLKVVKSDLDGKDYTVHEGGMEKSSLENILKNMGVK